MTAREELVGQVADLLCARRPGHPLRVGVDGITSSGKSTFADDLAGAVAARGRAARRVSLDDFHHLRERRHRLGRWSADGYYEDAYDLDAAARDLLAPLGPGGSRRYRERLHDLETDTVVEDAWRTAEPDAVVVVEGSFLQRPEVVDGWDAIVWLEVDFDVARARGVERDAEAFGGREAATAAFEQRYHAAARRYLRERNPLDGAGIVVDNNDVGAPRLVRAEDGR